MSRYRNVITPTLYGPMIINRFDTGIGYIISQEGSWDNSEVDLVRNLLARAVTDGRRMVLLDVGANIGSHTLALARLPNAEVHAFEAQRLVFIMMVGSVALNSLDNVYVYNRAVSDVSGEELSFPAVNYDHPANFGALELAEARIKDFKGARLPEKMETVTTLRIDDLNLTDVQLIKVDVEGMEHRVLRGAQQTIERWRPFIYLEIHKTPDLEAISAMLTQLDYTFYKASDRDVLCTPKEKAAFAH
ncbi:MAG: FkbM family methyltransferase [Magnetococcales bacterium]|nr:FkbM family methyltransferase [Magnetococcales bacterium]